jgi:hypothetical protein
VVSDDGPVTVFRGGRVIGRSPGEDLDEVGRRHS